MASDRVALPCGAGLLALLAAYVSAQPAQTPQPCVSDCLAEALAPDPTKGCPQGTYWLPYPGTNPVGTCQPCPPGFYCPGVPYGEYPDRPVNLNRRVPCVVGTFQDEAGTYQPEQCKNCTPGRYQDRRGQTACRGCPAGTYVGTNGTSSLDGCLPCDCGHYCPEASTAPVGCPGGTFSPNRRNREFVNCVDCPPGNACPNATCDPGGCATCPAGRYASGAVAGFGWGGGLEVCANNMDFCTICPAGFFCPIGSGIPTSCPPGTLSSEGAWSQEMCADCPVGHRCQLLLNTSTLQSLVYREANGELVVGSAESEACTNDITVVHYSYPNFTGCAERCPYLLPRQSFCHVAGDGRLPDPGRLTLKVQELVSRRAKDGLYGTLEREVALANLTALLANLSAEESLSAMTMANRNGRTPLIHAAMLGDAAALPVLWQHGASADSGASTSRDAGGFTALMHALRLGHSDVVSWLVGTAGAALSPVDAEVLQGLGVDVAGVPRAALRAAPEYLGRGGLTWVHPSGASFMDHPLGNGPNSSNGTNSSTGSAA